MVKKWYDSGQWYGKYYSAKLPQNPLKAFKEDYCSFIWNVTEFTITESKSMNKVIVNCIAPKFSNPQSVLISAFLEGVLNAFGFKISKRGFIRVGYKADIVIVDTNAPQNVSKENILYKCGWSPFEGTTFGSRITHTFINGSLIYNNGVFNKSIKGQRLKFER